MQWKNKQAMQLDAKIRAIAEDLGADFFGVADLAPAHDFISWQGGESLAKYPKGDFHRYSPTQPYCRPASWKGRKSRGDGI